MQRHWFAVAVAVCLFFSTGASEAAQLVVRVADGGGRPVAGAVVTLVPQVGTPVPPQRREPAVKVIDQKNLTFMPYVQVFRPGDAVVFRNSDRTRHHVYSFSPAKAFEFVLAPGQSSQPLTLANAGVVAVGCNIHDQMATYLVVSQAPWIAQAGTDGAAIFDDLPPGVYAVHAWHPRLRPGTSDASRPTVAVKANAPAALSIPLSLLPDRNRHRDPAMLQY